MFTRIKELCDRYDELMRTLQEPDAASDTQRFQKLMKEQSELLPIVETYRAYEQCLNDKEESLALLEEESDEEIKALAKEELAAAKKKQEQLEEEMKILLLPKDPNDDKNIFLEIRPAA